MSETTTDLQETDAADPPLEDVLVPLTAEAASDNGSERCTAETTAGGTVYRCALQLEHEGEHSFTALEETDTVPEDTALEPTEPTMPEEIEKLYKTVERSFKTYSGHVAALAAGAELPIHGCPLCPTPHKGFVNLNDAGRLPDFVSDEVKVFLGFAREQDYEQASNIEPCAQCKGKGKVLTGSKVAGNESVQCRNCNGFGYYPPPVAAGSEGPAQNVVHFPAGERPEPVDNGDMDLSGEPRILPDGRPNPNFGLWPQYKIQVPPWGTTAGLTAQDVPVSPGQTA
jgi:hypothetical protein